MIDGSVETGTDAGSDAKPTGIPGSWNLVFDDEFNGTSLDLTKWSTTWFNGGTMNDVATSAANVAVSGGNVILTLSSASTGAAISTNPRDTSGNPGKVGFQFTTGAIEARVYFPGNGTECYNWGAFWTTGQNWPTTGENDIAETLRGTPQIHHIDSAGNPSGGSCSYYLGNAFHIYGVERFSDHVVFYYDGVQIASIPSHEDVASSPQYVVLNIGNGHASPLMTGSTGAMLVDYVRAWQ